VTIQPTTPDGSLVTRVTRFCLDHRRVVLGVWLLLTVLGAVFTPSAVNRLAHTFATPGTAGYDANLHLFQTFGIDGNEQPTIGVLTLPPGQSMRTPAGQASAARVFAAANNAGHLAVADYANTHNPKLISADGRTTWALFDMPNPDLPLGAGVMEAIGPSLRAAAPAGASVSVTGFEQLQTVSGRTASGGPSVLAESALGGLGALVVLLLVYGSAVAVVPLLTAVPAIVASFLPVLGLTYLTNVNFLVEYLVAVMGLGIAIDYSLLLVTRWREEREAGRDSRDAVIAACPTAGRAVLLSGLTVAVGLLALLVLPVPFLRSIGIGSMFIPVLGMLASLTLLPVILATWGPALDRHRFRRTSTTSSRRWERWGALVVRRRWAAGALGLVVVLGLALPALWMNTGQPRANSLGGDGRPAQVLRALENDGVSSAVVFPVQLLVHGGPGAVDQVTAVATSTAGVYTVLAPDTPSFRHGELALVSVIPNDEGNTAAGVATVRRLRAALSVVPGTEVGGNTAQNIDFNHAVYGNFPLILTLVGAVTLLLLARTFRSVVFALKAVLVNIVSLGASFGFLVLFWQYGYGSHLIYGVSATGSIRNWIPVLAFAFLFGISMDYEVFILARMREEYDRRGSTDQAVVEALARTGRLVTSAAVILAISFASLSSQPDVIIEMIATGIGAGIVIDALVVRTLLVPALVAIMGRWNWWLPGWLAFVLRVPPTTGDLPAPSARTDASPPPRIAAEQQ
jgi:RND superfamily putative drug exporter